MKSLKLNLQDLRVKSFVTEIENEKLNRLRAGDGNGDSNGGGCDGGGPPPEDSPEEDDETFWDRVKKFFSKKNK